MKVDPTLARTYGDALFQAVQATGQLREAHQQTEAFLAALGQASDFVRFLEAPNVANDRKEELVRRSMGVNFDATLRNFVLLLIRRGRIHILRDALWQFLTYAERSFGLARATISSARPLSDDQRAAIEATMGRRLNVTLIPEYKVDPRLLGGIEFKSGDLLIDNTLRTRLRNLHERWLAVPVI